MAERMNQQKKVMTTKENSNGVSIVFETLVNILIALQIVLEEEFENCTGRIN